MPLNAAANTRIGRSPIGTGLLSAALRAGEVPALTSASRALRSCARIGRQETTPRAYAQAGPFDPDVDLQELARPLRRIAVVAEKVVPAVVEHDPAEAADHIARN